MPRINETVFKGIQIPLPAIEIQNEIVSHINTQKKRIKELRTKATNLRKEAIAGFEKTIKKQYLNSNIKTMKTSYMKHLKSIFKYTLAISIFMVIWLSFEDSWKNLFNFLCNYISSILKFKSLPVLNISITGLIFIGTICHFINAVKNRYIWDTKIFIVFILYITVYLHYRFDSDSYLFTFFIAPITCFDLLTFSVFLFVINGYDTGYAIISCRFCWRTRMPSCSRP